MANTNRVHYLGIEFSLFFNPTEDNHVAHTR